MRRGRGKVQGLRKLCWIFFLFEKAVGALLVSETSSYLRFAVQVVCCCCAAVVLQTSAACELS